MTDPRKIAFTDCETTGTHPARRPWEIAAIIRPAGGDVRGDTPYTWMIDVRDLDLGNADPKALEIGGFYRRHPQMADDAEATQVHRLGDALTSVEKLLRGAVVFGSNPGFDTGTLDPVMRACGILPSWHYHPIDVPSLAEGWLRGRGRPLPDQLKSDALCRAVDVDPDRYARHTALGDCELFRAVYERLILPVDVSSERVALAAELERPRSPLCDRDCADLPDREAPDGRDGQRIAHHCDCAAVVAAATVLRSMSATEHGRACVEYSGSYDYRYAAA